MTSAFSWQNSISLCPASFCTPRPNLPVTPGVSWLPTFAFQSSIMKRTSFLVLVLEGLVGLHRTIELHLLQHYWLGHTLILNGLPWKRTEIILSFFRLHPSTAFWTLLLTMMATPFLLRDSCHSCPLEEGMANHFSILALRTPWTVWKGKMIGYWKRNSPGQ